MCSWFNTSTLYLCWWLAASCTCRWSSSDLAWYSRLTCIHGEGEGARVTSRCGSNYIQCVQCLCTVAKVFSILQNQQNACQSGHNMYSVPSYGGSSIRMEAKVHDLCTQHVQASFMHCQLLGAHWQNVIGHC